MTTKTMIIALIVGFLSYPLALQAASEWDPLLEPADSSLPYLKREEYPKKIDEILSTFPDVPFNAVWGLAISGYTPEAEAVLTKIVCDQCVDETTRDYAAMGLGNYSKEITPNRKTFIQEGIRNVLRNEKADTPDGILRLLIKEGDAPLIQEILGNDLAGSSLEIDVLEALPDKQASDRLWKIYQNCPKSRKEKHYSRRASIGIALANRKDKRGIDILVTLLPAENAPSRQHRNNVYNFLATKLGNKFGYENGNYRPELEAAVPKMTSWWSKNREVFEFEPKWGKQ